MFLRAVLAFLMVPVVMTGIVPYILYRIDPYNGQGHISGLLFLCLGLVILLYCVRDFYISGKGTLAPWDPPKHLVIVGLYQYVRNPMYIGVMFILTGWVIITASPIIAAFTTLLLFAFHVRVITHEEPWAEKNFTNQWLEYKHRVPRWIPLWRAYKTEK